MAQALKINLNWSIAYAPEDLYSSLTFMRVALKLNNGWASLFATSKVRKNFKFYSSSEYLNNDNIHQRDRFILRNNKECILKALELMPYRVLRIADTALLKDQDFLIKAIKIAPDETLNQLYFNKSELLNDLEFMLKALELKPELTLEMIGYGSTLVESSEFMLKALELKPELTLQKIPYSKSLLIDAEVHAWCTKTI